MDTFFRRTIYLIAFIVLFVGLCQPDLTLVLGSSTVLLITAFFGWRNSQRMLIKRQLNLMEKQNGQRNR